MILDIDFVSDFVCPWCFLGHRRLRRAIDDVCRSDAELELRVNWLPFFLNPDTPRRGTPFRPYLDTKFGGARKTDAALARVAEAAAGDGLEFAFQRIVTHPNTLQAHRLIYRAQSLGYVPARVTALGEALFAAHFQEGRDIGDTATLAAIAAATGDDEDAVAAYLDGEDDAAAVRRMAGQLQRQGIEGVPFFIFNRRLAVSGAQSAVALGAAILQSRQSS